MKHYFKYAAGYINIDSENLFMTNSGNWQETHDLEEKSKSSARSNSFRTARMKGYVFSAFGMIGVFFFGFADDAGEISPPMLIGFGLLGLLAYFLFQYFKRDFGNRYKIPLKKITAIEPYEKGLRLRFLNAAGNTDTEVLDDVEPKGFEVLSKLGLYQTKDMPNTLIK